MNLKQAQATCRTIGMVLTKKDGELKVNFKGGKEELAYYTDDLTDAVQTAARMNADRITVQDRVAAYHRQPTMTAIGYTGFRPNPQKIKAASTDTLITEVLKFRTAAEHGESSQEFRAEILKYLRPLVAELKVRRAATEKLLQAIRKAL